MRAMHRIRGRPRDPSARLILPSLMMGSGADTPTSAAPEAAAQKEETPTTKDDDDDDIVMVLDDEDEKSNGAKKRPAEATNGEVSSKKARIESNPDDDVIEID